MDRKVRIGIGEAGVITAEVQSNALQSLFVFSQIARFYFKPTERHPRFDPQRRPNAVWSGRRGFDGVWVIDPIVSRGW